MNQAGAYAMRLPYPNWVELHVQHQNPENADLVNPATLREILNQLIAAWEPLWGGIFSFAYLGLRTPPQPDMTRQERGRRPVPPPKLFWNPGWMTYLSNDYSRIFVPPPDARIEN